MSAPPTAQPALTIGRVDATYLVARGHPDGDAAAWGVDATLRPRFASSCVSALEPLLDPADPSVWVIDRLSLETTLRVGDDPDESACRWGAALARAMAAVLRGEVTEGVVRYRNRAAFLAAFTADLVAGDGRRPVYAALAGVLALPLGRAVVTAAAGRLVPVAEVLLALAADGRLDTVLERLGPAEVRVVWDACCAEAEAAPPGPALVLRAQRMAAALANERPDLTMPELAVRLLVPATATPGVSPARAVRAVVEVVGQPPVAPAGLPRRPDAEEGRPEGGERPVDTGGRREPLAQARPPEEVLVASPYAGVLLVLPGLLAAGLHEVTARFPHQAAALRYRVLLRCLGPAGRFAAGDPALLLAAGLDPLRASPELTLPSRSEVTAALRDALVATGRVDAEATLAPVLVNSADGPVRLGMHGDLWLEAVPAPGTVADPTGPAADWAYLDTGSGPDDLAWTVLAHTGIRLFARRLIGFGSAGIPHLAENVFGRGGVVRVVDRGLDVLLEPPPLQVVLQLAGLSDQVLDVPWLDGPVRVRVRS